VDDVDASETLEQFAGDVLGSADTGRCKRELSGLGFRKRKQLRDAFRRHLVGGRSDLGLGPLSGAVTALRELAFALGR
jgi:hypothetical protein